jgi:hypothetical protein
MTSPEEDSWSEVPDPTDAPCPAASRTFVHAKTEEEILHQHICQFVNLTEMAPKHM